MTSIYAGRPERRRRRARRDAHRRRARPRSPAPAPWSSARWRRRSETRIPGLGRDPKRSNRADRGRDGAGRGRRRDRLRRSPSADPFDWIGKRADEFASGGTSDLTRSRAGSPQRRHRALRRLAGRARRRRPRTRCSATAAAAFSTATCANATAQTTRHGPRRAQRRAREPRRARHARAALLFAAAIARGVGIVRAAARRPPRPGWPPSRSRAAPTGSPMPRSTGSGPIRRSPPRSSPCSAPPARRRSVSLRGAPESGAGSWLRRRRSRCSRSARCPPFLSERYVNHAYADGGPTSRAPTTTSTAPSALNPLSVTPMLAEGAIARAAGDRGGRSTPSREAGRQAARGVGGPLPPGRAPAAKRSGRGPAARSGSPSI